MPKTKQWEKLLPAAGRLVDYEDGLARLLAALAGATGRGSGRAWALDAALSAVPGGPRSDLVTALIEAGDAHNEHWSSETAAALAAAAQTATEAQVAELVAAIEAGAR